MTKLHEGSILFEQSRAEQSRAEQSRAEQSRAEQSRAEQFLSKPVTTAMRGVLAIMVLACHIRARVPELHHTPAGSMLTVFGYWAVSAFFFLSGYGLMETYKAGGDEYIRRFPRKKIVPFYLTIWFFAILYIVKNTIVGTGISWERILVALLYPGNLVTNGWYLNTQLIFYWLFYIGFKVKKGVALTSLGIFLYVAVCITTGKGSTIYESVLPFILGLLCSQKKEHIAKRIYNHRVLFFLLTAVPFIITMLLGNISLLPEALRMAFKMISSCCFACFTVCLSTWIQPAGLLQWLGTYSLGIYALQGLWLDLDILLTHGSIIYVIGVVLLTIISAVMITPIVNNIKRLGKVVRMRGHT